MPDKCVIYTARMVCSGSIQKGRVFVCPFVPLIDCSSGRFAVECRRWHSAATAPQHGAQQQMQAEG